MALPLRSSTARYAVAVLAVLAALLLRLFLEQPLHTLSPFRLYFAAVMLAAAFAGLGPGLLAVALSCATANYFFMHDQPGVRGFDLRTTDNVLKIALFGGEGVLISLLSGMLHSARQRAEASEDALRRDQVLRERLEWQILEVSDHERQLVGADLHDGLGQHLTGIAFLSKVLCQKLKARSAPETPEAEKIHDLVNQAIAWTRDIARGLAPVELVREGLPGALNELSARAREMFHIDCAFHPDGLSDGLPMDEARAVHLYRIAQEAVTNAVKHGKAKRVSIDLALDRDAVLMTVTDDGRGFDPRKPLGRKSGLGLQMMKYRARMIDGALDLSPRPTGGTVVTCRLPLAPNAIDPINPTDPADPTPDRTIGHRNGQSIERSNGDPHP